LSADAGGAAIDALGCGLGFEGFGLFLAAFGSALLSDEVCAGGVFGGNFADTKIGFQALLE
jgi:hypothetical protein